MGMISNKRMLPLIIFFIIWENADEQHPMSAKELDKRVLDIYQPASGTTRESSIRLIRKSLHELKVFLEELKDYEFVSQYMLIKTVTGFAEGNSHSYYISGKPFTDTDVRMLCDAILFSPGLGRIQAKALIDKVVKLASKFFINVFQYIRVVNIIRRTDNDHIYENIYLLGEAINQNRQVEFEYNGRNGRFSPYHMVVYAGSYYLLCNKSSKGNLTHYRVDKIADVRVVDDERRKLGTLSNVDDEFDLAVYMKEHVRMSIDRVVTVNLQVHEKFVDAVGREFHVVHKIPDSKGDGFYMVKIRASENAICNWLINVTEHVWVMEENGSAVINGLVNRARCVMETYRESCIGCVRAD